MDGTPCANTNVEDGICFHHGCVPFGCGDGVIEAGETCDDGNRTSGDGCSALCDSNETCGNGIPDFAAHEECDIGIKGLSGDGCSSQCTVELENWVNISPPDAVGAMHGALAFDPRRHRVVSYNGTETWEFDGRNWDQRITTTTPPARGSAFVTYDAASGQVLLFGGSLADGTATDETETWGYDGVDWHVVPTVHSPPGFLTDDTVKFTRLAFDSKRGRVVAFNGTGTTWELFGGDWHPVKTLHRPPVAPGDVHLSSAMAFDAARGRTVLVVCTDPNTLAFETWEYDGTDWTQRTATDLLPPSPVGFDLAFDATHQRLIFADGNVRQLWQLEGTAWTPHATSDSPNGGFQQIVDDPDIGGILVLGAGVAINQGSETWFYDGSDLHNISRPTAPPVPSPAIAYDAARGRTVVLAGGRFDFDGRNWNAGPEHVPPIARLAYDSDLRHVVGVATNGGVWELISDEWIARPSPIVPPSRTSFALTYDSDRHALILFGGVTGFSGAYTFFADTWTFDDEGWHEITMPMAPPPRSQAVLVYDPVRHHTVLFGGTVATTDFGDTVAADTWTLDGTTWTKIIPVASPPSRERAAAAFDQRRGLVVMFGGLHVEGTGPDRHSTILADTWEYDGQWTARATLTTPVIPFDFAAAAMADDSVHQSLVLVGARDFDHSQTWRLSFTSALHPADQCLAGIDSDGDGLIACGDATHGADPDCAGRCTPSCPASNMRYQCDGSAPHCGDGTCDPFVEDYLLCPVDCSRP